MNQSVIQNELSGVNIAVASNSRRHRQHLQTVLERSGIRVLLNEPLSDMFLTKLSTSHTNLLLLDIDEREDSNEKVLDKLLDQTEIPILFNDVTALVLNEPAVQAKWYGKLLVKIAETAGKTGGDELDLDIGRHLIQEPASRYINQSSLARNVWVLGASLGGPDALKQFLAALPEDLPAAFILAQHLGANFVSLLAEQLNRVTPFSVMTAKVGHVLRHGEVIITPVNERIMINPIGTLELHPLLSQSTYSPSIDLAISDIALRYKQTAGTIIFSGMCDDGVVGAAVMEQQGGQVWVQDADSCVISAMPDTVRESGLSSFTGTPQQIAAKLAAYLRHEAQN